MFRNLRAEMAREGLDGKRIASEMGIESKTFSNKICGKTEFTRKEMFNIRNTFFRNCTIDYLFGDETLKTA